MTPKFKKGSLCLYNPTNYLGKYYTDVPVIILRMNKNYTTCLCLFPDGITGGCYFDQLKDVTQQRYDY